MAFVKIKVNNQTIMDLTEADITADILATGITAHNSSGEVIVGTMSIGAHTNENSIIQRNIVGSYENSRITRLGTGSLEKCMAMTSVSLPSITRIDERGLGECYKLASASTSAVTYLNTKAFSRCIELPNVDLPLATHYYYTSSQFETCSKLAGIVLPKWQEGTTTYMFRDCKALAYVDIKGVKGSSQGGYMERFNAECFAGCSVLSLIIIRTWDETNNKIPALNNVSAFNNTPFASGGAGGTIYIPKSLYDHLDDGTNLDMKAATNWSTLNSYGTITWAQIENSYYETHYADGTLIS